MADEAFRRTPKAMRDLEEIYAFFAKRFGEAHSETSARLLLDACSDLLSGAVASRPTPGRPAFRTATVDPHVLVARFEPGGLEVHGFLHQRMDLASRISRIARDAD